MKLASNLLLVCVGLLLTLGLVVLYSASTVQVGARFLMMQLLWAGIGLVAMAVAASVDYRRLQAWSIPLLFLAVVVLVLVLVPGVGVLKKGARRWFDLGFASVQPAEFAKLAVVIALAAYGARFARYMREFWRGLVLPSAGLFLVLALIAKEPDYGSTVILGAVGLAVLIMAGVRWHYVIPILLIGLLAISAVVWSNPNRRARILAFVHPEQNRDGVGYQSYQAMIALGSGGVQGTGLGNGRHKHGFLPEHQTDFIFSMIGEELGLVATLGVVLAFGILVSCGLRIALGAGDRFGVFLGVGLTLLVGLQALVNMGVVTGLLPSKGLPLPFISYGGSNLLLMMLCVGLLLSIARHADGWVDEVVAEGPEDPDGNQILTPEG